MRNNSKKTWFVWGSFESDEATFALDGDMVEWEWNNEQTVASLDPVVYGELNGDQADALVQRVQEEKWSTLNIEELYGLMAAPDGTYSDEQIDYLAELARDRWDRLQGVGEYQRTAEDYYADVFLDRWENDPYNH